MDIDSVRDYDGFFFTRYQDENSDGIKYDFFKFKDEFSGGIKQDGNDIGDMYHILFIETNDDGETLSMDNFDKQYLCNRTKKIYINSKSKKMTRKRT